MADRRRINGPSGDTRPPVFASSLLASDNRRSIALERPIRSRKPDELRKIFLKTGLIPSASGSAYLEFQTSTILPRSKLKTLIPPSSSLKLTCTVHGPKPLPRSAPFSPNLLLSTHVKFAPFATRRRRSYIRDVNERDLGVHLETALKGVIIGERWPKSGLDITVTILEGEDDRWWGDALSSSPFGGIDGWGLMNVLAGCITVASAAIVDARIDCVDLITGGVAAFVENPHIEVSGEPEETNEKGRDRRLVLDPDPSEHRGIAAACVVGYMPSRDEITELWLKGDTSDFHGGSQKGSLSHEALIDGAVNAARGTQAVLMEASRESAERFAMHAGKELAPSTANTEGLEIQI
ncbi:3' exoribonuclease family protein [Paracoccidioides lutzii Pb01]|uniref:3' exoribonuclease family protein n=1 Tax=Paracoccidioides lutzii (strain ATCC MYA-826 / Pb01) TaxID=502779 RepID=C1GZK2_PARBA|nr:3' exoribonuclease family protein [Paracoccidioides lutzii Pb01]EEH42025.1 3' exoribonuclease family protein [Paracoccidioides lutzii Pb01]